MDSKTEALVAKARKHEAAAKQLRKAVKEAERKEREAEREDVAELFAVLLTPGYRDAWRSLSEVKQAEVAQRFADGLLANWKQRQAPKATVAPQASPVSRPAAPAGTPPAAR